MSNFIKIGFILHIFPTLIFTDSGLRGPPYVTTEMLTTYKVKLGDTVKIDCPIDSGPSLQVYYEWKKDGETITSAWERFRITPKKLRIRGVVAEDGGIFNCKGTNGFGSKELSTRLIVQDENGGIVGGGVESESESSSTNKNSFPDEMVGFRPSFTQITAPPYGGSTFRPIIGSSLTLRCRVDGNPFPTVTWLRLRGDIPTSKGQGQELQLVELNFDDSGVYYCIGSNIYGQVNASFIVEVIESGMEGPTILSLESSNLTVGDGGLIHFRCLISSQSLPNVQWLRQLGTEEIDPNTNGLQMAGLRYKVIGSGNRVMSYPNGTYLSELSLPGNGIAGAEIVCLATNSGGFKFQATRINLISRNGTDDHYKNDTILPMTLLVAIPATFLFLLLVLTLLFCCFRGKVNSRNSHHHHHHSTGAGTITTTTTYATPRDATTNEYQAPPDSFYDSRRHHHTTPNFPTYPHRQQYFNNSKDGSESPIKNYPPTHYLSSPAYASVPVCETTISPAMNCRGPPLPSRTNPILLRDRNNFHTQGLLTQPLLTQTASSSDSRDSRQSCTGGEIGIVHHRTSGATDFAALIPPPNPQRQVMDHWCLGSSWDNRKISKTNNHHQQIRV